MTAERSDQSAWPFGIAPNVYAKLARIFEQTPGLARVWVYGSRGRGTPRPESDIDLAVEWDEKHEHSQSRLWSAVESAEIIYRIDLVSLSDKLNADFRARIERDRKVFWEPRRYAAATEAIGSTQLKPFQSGVLAKLDAYLAELKKHAAQAKQQSAVLRAMEGADDLLAQVADFPKKAWEALKKADELPPTFASQPHSSRWTGEVGAGGTAIPNLCLKVPTGGGKTLLAAASVGRVFSSYLNRHTGLVLWIVPNEAIYRQTLKTLANRDHPYRQMLNVAGAGRVKILQKDSPLSRIDVESHLCVMLLMLQSAARKDEAQRKLKAFRDRGNVLGFVPREDDVEAHWNLLREVPNLDVYAPFGASAEDARKTKGSIVKSSLGNVMRLQRPMVVIDEGHHAYSENALRTLDGFNPSFLLELSATPRIASANSANAGSGSNILVDVRGTDLDEAEMIKLPIHVDVRGWSDWQSCLTSAVERLAGLQREADELHAENNRYIRPILLVQVERTGKDMRDAGFIHAEDAKAWLMQLGFTEAQIAIKTSEKDELKQPENLDLLSPACEVRAIITKQALQEGWDCPFAYVLCALAAGREIRAMTQLVGRILRQPHVVKTGRAALDSCYVLCHNARTGEVVKAIKGSLESEGMGDLGISVTGEGGDTANTQRRQFHRRERFARLRIFLPRVTWVESDGSRRELNYESDVLAGVDWSQLDAEALARDWAPGVATALAQQFDVGLDVLDHPERVATAGKRLAPQRLDRALLVRGLLDIAPNAWWVWSWTDTVIRRLAGLGFGEELLAASLTSLLERLRVDIEGERDRLAQTVFNAGVAAGNIEFRLRADALDYEIPEQFSLDLSGRPRPLAREDGMPVEKSLFEPALAALVDTGFESDVACYLDTQAALQWWHRNVAKAQYGLQGWKRHKVYPDFVFAKLDNDGATQLVVLETKGLHLAGSHDTNYKQKLLERLSEVFSDERAMRAGELELVHGEERLVCDMVFDEAWRGSLVARHF
ncbi:MAG: DEAD/DEAH box helicase family protein [Sulfuritalea sp.]|nr:DEAD/DEAH box helicase family protein [Sulfuritalea sp.]